MKIHIFAGAVFGLVLSSAAGSAADLSLPAGAPAWLPSDFPLSVIEYTPPPSPVAADEALGQAAAGKTIPLWSASVTSLGSKFKYTMVGQNPQVKLKNPATKVKVVVIPVKFTFSPQNVVFDPTAADPNCSPAGTPLELALASPIFKNVKLTTAKGTVVGTGQYPDLFQRGNFFKSVSSTNPKFSFTLVPAVQKALAIKVTGGTVQAAPCGNLGIIDQASWDSFVQKTVFPKMKAVLTPTTFPFFMFYNVVMDQNNNPSNCCILGYHNAFKNSSHSSVFQTYGISDYDTTQAFLNGGTGIEDTSIMSHEIDEWLDDPNISNPTPPWGHFGQVSGCQGNLEVGDPLTGTLVGITMPNGFTYHVQDLAFFSWFYRQVPSIGVDGLYSLLGTFTKDAGPVCK